MENNPPRPMTPFDELVTTPQLQAVKLLLPYIPVTGRPALAACVKFLEFRQALSMFGNRGGISAQAFQKGPGSSPMEILSALRPYLGKKECDTLDMILNLKDMMDMVNMMKTTSDGSSSPDPMDLLGGMLSPEQQEMFHTYSAMFSQTDAVPDAGFSSGSTAGEPSMKGDESDERMDEQSGHEEYGSGETGTDPDGSRTDIR